MEEAGDNTPLNYQYLTALLESRASRKGLGHTIECIAVAVMPPWREMNTRRNTGDKLSEQ